MIRIRKSKTTRKKLTGPSVGKSVTEKASPQVTPESRDQPKGQSRDQLKSQLREQPKEHSKDQFKGQPRNQPKEQFKGQPREQSKDHFRGDHSKKRRFPFPKKASRERTEAPESRAPCEPATPEEELEKGGFVLPGELIGTIEEFKPGEGTTVSVGDIYSSATGNIVIDRRARIVSVRPSTVTPNILKVGDVIYGKIIDVRESGAMVEIAGIEGKEDREIVNVRTGDIHVSNVRDSYVKRLSDEFRPSDIIRARVIDAEKMRLTTAEDSLGVVKAYCSNCRGELVLEGKKLKCPVCNMTETRKISTEYGKGIR
ncbi:MAG: exosome complex RNA-binding protein Csl4 [Methanosarcina thermophila]|jgi:exosome complex component CSL4|uniref:Exosome complex component Csl4 n=3 Tax=Methanosarcina thermophila TaxID=2210 RepID=A0A1I6XDX4_METTE|nr:exosome complex RNA-binding protein Csl4 [Methanosarcina thermophila]ALK04507.1 MAG: RNA-binding protein [Methanosarcina sp. 795]AKB13156.1 exosome complex RNA-binding protein Csl4 [Methanosarcina thermophila TM-1]AKB16208.1 exosome complex RNA-binding protein Csl4 [Methanosarcina thermophila CHTI-55]NLU57118.1 exosome complex RNA-binding protein Csl4 [Methanosarcina thermophila]SFT36293.1 exosome complex component CSL4 [Methanosarcina thermophila]